MVVGNPTNPTSVLHPREDILRLRRPGRIVVVDEAFADAIPGEPESLAAESLPDVLVLRSLTKTWSLPGLRVGYALGAPDVLHQLTTTRPHWPLGTLQLEALTACNQPDAVAAAREQAPQLAVMRSEMVDALEKAGVRVVDGRHRFVLFEVPDAHLVRKHLSAKGIAVRRCDTFVGLDGQYPAGRGPAGVADAGDGTCGGPAVSVRLADIIDVLERGVSAAVGAVVGFGGSGVRRSG